MQWMEKGEESVRDTRGHGSRFSLKSLGASGDNPLANLLYHGQHTFLPLGSHPLTQCSSFCYSSVGSSLKPSFITHISPAFAAVAAVLWS